MPTWYSVALSSVLIIVFGTLLVRRIAHDYFPQASLGIVWLVTIGFDFGTCVFTYCFNSTFYNVPMACAIALVLMGLWFWQISKRDDGTINGWFMAAGSICMGLLLGTRPQFIVAWVLAFPLFWPQITKYRTLFSRNGLWQTVAALAPFVVVGVPVLYYNYVRFGSWTDFGAYYNLTGYDLTSRKASRYTFLPALFTQLFQPPSTTSEFPFLTTTDTVLRVEQTFDGRLLRYFPDCPHGVAFHSRSTAAEQARTEDHVCHAHGSCIGRRLIRHL